MANGKEGDKDDCGLVAGIGDGAVEGRGKSFGTDFTMAGPGCAKYEGKQVGTSKFGLDGAGLIGADGLEIKVGQGKKPWLPGGKVDPVVLAMRNELGEGFEGVSSGPWGEMRGGVVHVRFPTNAVDQVNAHFLGAHMSAGALNSGPRPDGVVLQSPPTMTTPVLPEPGSIDEFLAQIQAERPSADPAAVRMAILEVIERIVSNDCGFFAVRMGDSIVLLGEPGGTGAANHERRVVPVESEVDWDAARREVFALLDAKEKGGEK